MTNYFSINQSFSGAWNTDWSISINPYHKLEERIAFLAQQNLSTSLSKQQKVDLKQSFRLAHSWLWPAGRMQKLLSTLSTETLQTFLFDLMATENEREYDYYLQCSLSLLSEKTLLKLSGFNTTQKAAIAFQIHHLTQSTVLRNPFAKEGVAVWKEFFVEATYFIHHLLAMLISITGLNEITRQKHSHFGPDVSNVASWEATSKLEFYWELIAYPATIFGIIYSYINFTIPAVILTSATIVATLTALVAYNRYWRPCPLDHMGLKNLSIDLLREKNSIYPRLEVLKKIETAFQAKKGVILIGSPGAGKSWMVRSFVQQALAGKICTFIKNPQIFACNGSSFKFGAEMTSLSSIEERFKRHSDQVVFFFDEFHSLFNHDGVLGNAAGEQIKTFCEDFKYVIGATTTEEYEKYLKNQPTIVDRRFEIIQVQPMNSIQVKTSLSQQLQNQNSHIAFSPSVIDYIMNKAAEFNPKTAYIDAAHSLLNCAIQKMTSLSHNSLEARIASLEDEICVLEQQLIHAELSQDLVEVTEQLKTKKAELATLIEELDVKKRRTQRLQAIETYHLKLKRQCYLLAKASCELNENPKLSKEWIELHARIAIVRLFIAKERDELGLPLSLNAALIDSILKERSSERQSV